MDQHARHAMFGLACTLVLIAAGSASKTHAFSCPGGAQPPRCSSAPSSSCSLSPATQCASDADCTGFGVCNYRIGGSAIADPSSAGIQSITLQGGAVNLSLTPSIPTFTVSQTSTASDASGIIEAKDFENRTCTVSVTFHKRNLGPPVNEDVCVSLEGFSVKAISGGSSSSPAGTTTCSSVLAQCSDVAPGGEEFVSPSRILTIRSPIRSVGATPDVVTDLTRDGAFNPALRLAFARAATPGGAFGLFTDITTSTTSGFFAAPALATIIRGTGQWSDVKVGVSTINPAGVPTLGEWGIVILSLLLLASSSVLFASRRTALADGGGHGHTGRLPVDRRLLLRALGTAGLLWIAGVASLTLLREAPSPTDLIGSLITSGILAYQAHLWILQARR